MRIFISLGACLFMFCSGVQAQGKFGNFLKKVNKTLEETNQTLEDVNNVLDGKDVSTDENGETKIVSPTRDLQLKFEKCYDEGHDVVVALKITNTTDKEIGLNWGGGEGYDNLGNAYKFGSDEFTIGGRDVSPLGAPVPAGIPAKALIRLEDVNDKATSIKKLIINTYQYKGFEVRDIPITRDQSAGQENDSVRFLSPTRLLELEYKDSYIEETNDLVINFKITNTGDEEIGLNWGSGRAWDDDGNMYEFGSSEFTVSGKEVSPTGVGIPAGIPVNACIILRGVNKKATVIKLVKFDTYQYKGFEIREVPVKFEN